MERGGVRWRERTGQDRDRAGQHYDEVIITRLGRVLIDVLHSFCGLCLNTL